MTIADVCIQRALEATSIREPVLRAVIESLELPRGSRGLDAGCGIGLQALLLAEALGTAGRITGIDILPELLAYGRGCVQSGDRAEQIDLCAGDAGRLPFARHSFDWAWSADCIGYPLGQLAPFLAELVRVVRPGGDIVLLGWSSQQLLPGYPFLEARLNATCSAYLPYIQGRKPELNFLQAMRWLREAGLEDVRAGTFAGDVHAPVSGGERAALASLFAMLWGERQPDVSDEDWQEYRRLCQPDSPDFIVDEPGYYAFFTYSVFRGNAP
jgi:demethylmenaquinone methyltransferase/2-methoxy-6-polyprenyl-1,4-benzoquinol methylase